MITTNLRLLGPQDGVENIWLQLRRFQNTSYNYSKITEYQNPPVSFRRFVEKQSRQIRHCLIQAEEYFKASNSVGYATSPLLLYYSSMSLSLAEILIKQNGDSSLDRLRQLHNHHGLEMKGGNDAMPGAELAAAASTLKATPHERSGKRVGTFNVWHRSARETSIAGETKTLFGRMQTTSRHEIILYAEDKELPEVPADGISLLDCFKNIPRMQAFLLGFDIQSELCRARIDQTIYTPECGLPKRGKREYTIFIHPQNNLLIDSVIEKMKFNANLTDDIEIIDAGGGYIFKIPIDQPLSYGFHLPAVSQESVENISFYSKNNSLNEYGYIYTALFILGNYARYFPDKWMQEIELATPLAVAAMEFMHVANEKVPLLANAALSNTAFLRP